MTLKPAKTDKPATDPRRAYVATATGWIAGTFCQSGDPVMLTPQAAAYEHVAPAPVVKAKADK